MSEDFDIWTDFSGEPFNSLQKQVEDLETDQMKLNFLTENIERLKNTISLNGVYPLDIEMAIRWGEDKITGLKYSLQPKALEQKNIQTEQSVDILQNANNEIGNSNIGISKIKKNSKEYPIIYRNQIIEAAVRLLERNDNCKEVDLIEEMLISKSTLYRRKNFFNLTMPIIKDEALSVIREKSKNKEQKR